jgi:hypothetical protein
VQCQLEKKTKKKKKKKKKKNILKKNGAQKFVKPNSNESINSV